MAIYRDQVDEGIRYLKLAKVCFEELKYSAKENEGQSIFLGEITTSIGDIKYQAETLKRLSTSIEELAKEIKHGHIQTGNEDSNQP